MRKINWCFFFCLTLGGAAIAGEIKGSVHLASQPANRKVGPEFVWQQSRYAKLGEKDGSYSSQYHSRLDGPGKGVLESQDEIQNTVIEVIDSAHKLPLTAQKKQIPGRNVMAQIDKNFEPHVVVVPQGSTVYFANKDPILHHIYSLPKPPDGFEIAEHRDTRAQNFSKAGTYELFCGLHPRMNGYVYVSHSDFAAKPDAGHQFHFSQLPPGKYKLRVWHPRIPEKELEVTVPAQGAVQVDIQL